MFKNKEEFKQAFLEKLHTLYGECLDEASDLDKYNALGSMIRDHIAKYWTQTNKQYRKKEVKQVYYFSMEFLLGRLLGANLINLSAKKMCEEALKELGIDLNLLENIEPDAGLGNGGLGRLAACFLDSLASLSLPGHGCGIRYKYGFFEQRIVDGYQVELPDNWLRDGNVWEIRKADNAVEVRFYGNVRVEEQDGRTVFIHENYEPIIAVPYDTPIIGYERNTVNTLRLWSAEPAIKDFDFSSFSRGDYVKAVEYRSAVESISQILYPDESHYKGRELRLKQQYFFVSAGLQCIVRRYKKYHGSLKCFHKKIAIHVNDTHPVLAIPELMRILIDEEGMGWDEAWDITVKTISYTNHTILTEALEKWPVDMFRNLLPRIYMIVHEINERFCRELWNKYPGDWDRIHKMAIIADGQVKMAHLAIVGSHSINGVSKIHTEILKNQEMKNFYEVYPHKFNNKTNGVTHRRWLLKANPALANLISETIGANWIKYPIDLISLEKYRNDTAFLDKLAQIKQRNKAQLAKYIKDKYNISVDLHSIFDVQVKRMHAYKRQLLNVLHIMDLYNRLRENPDLDIVPRTFIFGAKASPSYVQAKTTIKLINTLASMINNDKRIKDKIKVIFLENYRVTLAEMIFPAADLSEQISTAGKEASGTGNMKFMMNGAVTIGTMDGANIEICEVVGRDNIFIFGLTAEEVANYYHNGGYCSWDVYAKDSRVKTVVDQLVNGFFPVAGEEFRVLYDDLTHNNDPFFVLKDFASYADTQLEVDKTFRDKYKWQKMSLVNIAHSGKFSSDRTITEYATQIWNIKPEIITNP
ncbi:glycogen/starch/alpha-glucan phosphorylase [Thermincola potens]|uniref:Alpha-1,4 glucan phosphorylase n=1 Tax=Thermincola potens (strain JR) TaxID=635013 RepID=D5XDC6_THEPJ|nr:glycogen/starch/alpha-glucan phosphorylase [Thermincola potens]ADG81774.1 glycogen/starch/alpha-glucan phosphorylase [Thermincola potens JR]